MKSYKEFLNEGKNISGKVLGSDFQIYDYGKGKHIIVIVGDKMGNQYEHPIYLKGSDTIEKLRKRFYYGKSITIPNPMLGESEVNEERKHKYNSIAKVKSVIGSNPTDDDIIDFIRKEYDLSNSDHADIVADIVGYYKIDPEDYFDEDGNLL